MKKAFFSGVATAVVTPFDKDNNVDYKSMAKILDFQISGGVNALVINGTTGEASTLTYEERINILKFTNDFVKGRIPVIVGVGSNNYMATLKMIKDVSLVGADGLLVVTPYYNKTTQEGLVKIFEGYGSATDIPIIAYNVPSRTAVNILPETYKKMSENGYIGGVKEASSDISALAESISLCPNIPFYSGNDDLTLPALSLGARGVISVTSNLFPKLVTRLCDSFFAGDIVTARKTQLKLVQLNKALFASVNPIPVKYALSKMGLCQNILRLPLVPLDGDKCDKMDGVLSDLGVKI